MSVIHPAAAEGFARGADTYVRGRPDFPPAALEWLRGDLGLGPGRRVVDLGAGTGKFTRLLVQTGADVVAVEPVAPMLAHLARDLPEVEAIQGDARRIPLADGSRDAIVCAQAFHWFASHDALSEIHRVLKPGGVLGLIWNIRDESVGWLRKLTDIMTPYEGDAPRYYKEEWRRVFPASGFGEFHEREFAHAHVGPAEQVIVQRVASVSFIAALDDARRNEVLDEVRALIAQTPALAGSDKVSVPYLTRAYWCRSR